MATGILEQLQAKEMALLKILIHATQCTVHTCYMNKILSPDSASLRQIFEAVSRNYKKNKLLISES